MTAAVKDFFLTIFLVLIAAAAAVIIWEGVRANFVTPPTAGQGSYEQMVPVDQGLKIPPEIKTAVGKPTEVLADSRGKEVMWMALDQEVNLLPLDSRSVWAWSNKKGTYRIIGWTSINNRPTPPSFCKLIVEDEVAPDKK